MIRFVLVCWLIAFCWVQSADSTEYLKNLLTTTPSSSHISDFRKQKRTDSRADKPDTFPGFDLHEDSTTPSPRKRRRQAYSQLIRLFLQNTRDRLDTIRDVIKDESELHFRVTRPPGEVVTESSDSMEQNAEIRFSDDDNRQFIDFAFADATNADESSKNIDKIENKDRDNAAHTYLNSLFAAFGYHRITTTPNPIESDDETTSGNIIARYLINPLVSAWNSTRERFNWNDARHGDNDDNSNDDDNDDESSSDASDGQTMLFRVNFFDNLDNITPNMHTNSTSVANKDPNENRVDNFNYSLPLIQLTPNNVTDDMLTNETMTTLQVNANTANVSQTIVDVDYIGEDHIGSDKKPRNTVNTVSRTAHSVEDAADAFRNAFLKYSNYMQQQQQQNSTEHAKFDTSTNENAKFTRNKDSHAMKNDKLILDGDGSGGGGGFFAGNLFESNSSHIQVVPSKTLKTNASSISENVTTGNDVDDIGIEPAKSFSEKAGVLILEIFGTVIGMTWRAVSGIPNYLNAQHNNNQNEDA
ncbi:putative uncharacterized protein DDB_G0287265 [Sitodiplosis mosellana]|uniref:putative uncharacterized protein DDB_G0287265 n=1 Tax=Sitodiplosis mosellana TaxID=263140 RepID=UPI0024437EB4|nr:putative uncharacterized protein DDB_G0287265 [Sitodiplosis mosellana]